MNNDYVVGLLVDQRLAEFHHQADQDRLARSAGRSGRRWWERLMLFHTAPAARRRGTRGPAATVAVHAPR